MRLVPPRRPVLAGSVPRCSVTEPWSRARLRASGVRWPRFASGDPWDGSCGGSSFLGGPRAREPRGYVITLDVSAASGNTQPDAQNHDRIPKPRGGCRGSSRVPMGSGCAGRQLVCRAQDVPASHARDIPRGEGSMRRVRLIFTSLATAVVLVMVADGRVGLGGRIGLSAAATGRIQWAFGEAPALLLTRPHAVRWSGTRSS